MVIVKYTDGVFMSDNRKRTGKWGEDYAVDYLSRKGYKIISRNFRFERNEIDIIAEDKNILVFVEVKTAKSLIHGNPEDKVDPRKQKHIQKVAEGYIFQNNIFGKACRFDVIAIQNIQGEIELKHFVDAFGY